MHVTVEYLSAMNTQLRTHEFMKFSVRNATGVVELDRPKAFNAVNHDMALTLVAQLKDWAADDAIEQVVVYTEHPKAFCSGGDVRYAFDTISSGDHVRNDQFFNDSYAMDAYISEFPKPYISLIDGLVMGGGLGISLHASHRVITEKVWASMPETSIGYITDVGVSFTSQRTIGTRGKASPELAKYWAITGHRMKAADMVWMGLATHCVADAAQAREAIINEGVDAALERLNITPAGEPELAAVADIVEEIFTERPWHEIAAALDAHPNREFADHVARATHGACVTSIVASNALFNAAAKASSVREELGYEVALGEYLRRRPDFIEGIRSVLVDKDRAATFNPATIDQVDTDAIHAAINAGRTVRQF